MRFSPTRRKQMNYQKPKIVLLTPHHSDLIYFKAALSIWGQSIYCDHIITPADSPSASLAFIRNDLVSNAFKAVPDFTHLLWLDGDEIYPQNMTPRLLEHDKDIVAAWVNIRQNLKANVYKILYKNERGGFKHRSYTKKEINQFISSGQPLQEIERVGLGSVLVKREVYEKVPQPWFSFDEHHDCEDLYFFDRCREYGYKIYCDFSLRCLHISLAYL